MSIIALGWIVGLHVVMAVWLGILASAWKKRNTWRWIGIGLCTSVIGLILLMRLPKLTGSEHLIELDMQMQHLDGTSLLQ